MCTQMDIANWSRHCPVPTPNQHRVITAQEDTMTKEQWAEQSVATIKARIKVVQEKPGDSAKELHRLYWALNQAKQREALAHA